MQVQFDVENIKCGGCAGTIKKKLMEDERISHVGVNIEQGVVIIDADIDASEDWRSSLLNMGYPEKGSAEGSRRPRPKPSPLSAVLWVE